jgi:7-cyano-7-deazaguanine synthase in queuosine biosynthesis
MLLLCLSGERKMSSKGVSFIFPVLNEDIKILFKTIILAKKICYSQKLNYEIFLCDGGSNFKTINLIKNKISSIKNITLLLDFPLIKPNKDIAIMNALKLCKYENIIISDVDIKNLIEDHFNNLIKNLLKNFDFVIPNLNRSGGRWNRLLGNPFMRLCFEKEYIRVPYPAPGILGIKKKVLEKIVGKDFFYDWGGEIQIAIEGALASKRICSPPMYKVDSKKRPINNMIKDAFQVWRTNLYLMKKHHKKPNLINYKIKYKKEHEEFLALIKETKSLSEIFNNENYLNLLKENCGKDPKDIFNFLDRIYKKTGLYEFKVINYFVAKPLLYLLFGIKTNEKFIEKSEKKIKCLNMKKISIFVDYVIYFIIKKAKNYNKFLNFEECLESLKLSETDFISKRIIDLAEENQNEGIILDNISDDLLKKIKKTINQKNIFIKNEKLLSLIKEDLIGKIDHKNITFSLLKYKEKNVKLNKNDFFIKTSILTTIAGYLKKNYFFVNHYHPDKKKIERFLSYILNNKKYAPINYQIELDFSKDFYKEVSYSNNYDCIVLFSGGIDSTAASLLTFESKLNPLLLWVGFGQKNEKEELSKIKKISKKIKMNVAIVNIDLKKYIENGWKEWSYIIPARNFMLVSIAAAILSNSKKEKGFIIMSAHKEEIKNSNTDKSNKFFRTCSKIFSDYYKKKIIVTTPFYDVTKTEVLSYWKKNWIKKYKVKPYDTTTCYYGNNCGECNACYKRNLALIAAGLKMDKNLKKNIFSDNKKILINNFIKRMDSFPKKRKYEYLIALTNMKEKNSPSINAYLTKLSKREKRIMEKRKREIENINLRELRWI